MKDNCNCFLCQIRKELEAELTDLESSNIGEAQGSSALSIEEDMNAAQVNLTLATTVDLLTQSLQRADEMNDQGTVAGIRRALAKILPPAEEPVAATAPAEPTSEGLDIPAEIDAMAKALAEQLGCEVRVFGFPKK